MIVIRSRTMILLKRSRRREQEERIIMRGYAYIIVDWDDRDYFQVEAPTRSYRVVHAKDSYEALRRVLQIEGVIFHAHVNLLSSEHNVASGYVAYYYKVVY